MMRLLAFVVGFLGSGVRVLGRKKNQKPGQHEENNDDEKRNIYPFY